MEKSRNVWLQENEKRLQELLHKLEEYRIKGLDENNLGLLNISRIIQRMISEIARLHQENASLKEKTKSLESKSPEKTS